MEVADVASDDQEIAGERGGGGEGVVDLDRLVGVPQLAAEPPVGEGRWLVDRQPNGSGRISCAAFCQISSDRGCSAAL